jgi:hypothetical protein
MNEQERLTCGIALGAVFVEDFRRYATEKKLSIEDACFILGNALIGPLDLLHGIACDHDVAHPERFVFQCLSIFAHRYAHMPEYEAAPGDDAWLHSPGDNDSNAEEW